MEYRRLGKSGLQVSLLSYGSWVSFSKQINDKTAEELMSIAYDNGVNFFDNAEGYNFGESEKLMGKILKKMKWHRDSYAISSKVFLEEMENSQCRLASRANMYLTPVTML